MKEGINKQSCVTHFLSEKTPAPSRSIQRKGRLLASTHLAEKPRKWTGYSSDKKWQSAWTHSNMSSLQHPGGKRLRFLVVQSPSFVNIPFLSGVLYLSVVTSTWQGHILLWISGRIMCYQGSMQKSKWNPVVIGFLINNISNVLPDRVIQQGMVCCFLPDTHSQACKYQHLAQGSEVQGSQCISPISHWLGNAKAMWDVIDVSTWS